MSFKNRKSNYPLYETTKFSTVREMVENAAKRFGDKNAIVYKKNPNGKEISSFSFNETRERVRAIATEFIAMGMQNKTVALIGEASPEWIFSYFALMSMGAVCVPIDKELPCEDAASIINTAECEFLVFSSIIEEKALEIKATAPTLKTLIEWGKAQEGAFTLDTVYENGTKRVDGGDNSYLDYDLDPDKLASIVFTSGTTGKGKGVMLTSRNICSDMEQGMYNFQITYKTLLALPPHHTFGSTVNIIGHFAQGCEIYVSSGLRYIMGELKDFKPSHLVLVPLFVETFYKRIMSAAEKSGKLKGLKFLISLSNFLRKIGIDMRKKFFKKSVLSNFGGELEMIISGGAALNQSIIDFFESIGVIILNGYGITECAPLISCNRNEYRKQGSVGMPIIGGHVYIYGADANGEGEICYTGPNVMLGYYKNEEATRDAFLEHDGKKYFRTGDCGRVELDADGNQWIYITGRYKNLIILSNGKNVYPEEIETDIQGVFGVSEVVVYQGESKNNEELIVAEIFPDYDALKMRNIENAAAHFEAAVKEINKKNPPYKKVDRVKIRNEEFPKNTSRKITRFKIDKTVE